MNETTRATIALVDRRNSVSLISMGTHRQQQQIDHFVLVATNSARLTMSNRRVSECAR